MAAKGATVRFIHALHEGQANRYSSGNPRPFAVSSRHHQSQVQAMRTKKREIEFDAEALLTRVEDFAAGREPAKERAFKLPPPVKSFPAKEIRALRLRLGFTQAQFASLLNVPKVTAISWENGTRSPSGAALRLLAVVRAHPEALEAL
jgi:putative transcriptional regulator